MDERYRGDPGQRRSQPIGTPHQSREHRDQHRPQRTRTGHAVARSRDSRAHRNPKRPVRRGFRRGRAVKGAQGRCPAVLTRSARTHVCAGGVGAITPAELTLLEAAGACGDVLAHYITSNGEIAYDDIDKRTVGLSLDDVRNANCAIAVAAGRRKVPVVNGALVSGLCSVLITDEPTAQAVLEQ